MRKFNTLEGRTALYANQPKWWVAETKPAKVRLRLFADRCESLFIVSGLLEKFAIPSSRSVAICRKKSH